MKYPLLLLLLAGMSLAAIDHPITFVPGTDDPASFRTPGNKPDGVRCITNAEGEYVFRINARNVPRKIISEQRIAVKEGDTVSVTYTLNFLKGEKGQVAFGFYLYHEAKGNYLPLPALYAKKELLPGKKEYTFTAVIPRSGKKAKAVSRPNTGVLFLDVGQGVELDVEKIRYEVKSPVRKNSKKAAKKSKTTKKK